MCHSPREGMMASHDSNGSGLYIYGSSDRYPQPAHLDSMRSPRVSGNQPEECHVLGQMIQLVVFVRIATGIKAQGY